MSATFSVPTRCGLAGRRVALLLPWLAALVSATALAAGSATLVLDGAGPYHRLPLPASIHTLAADPDLNDLRLRNGAGQPLAWAWAQDEQRIPVTRSQAVSLFPVPARGATGPDALNLRLRADGAVVWRQTPSAPPAQADWIVDAHQAVGSLLRLRLTMAPQSLGLFPLAVDASDDLRQWWPVVPQTAVMRLVHQGQQLQQSELDLGGARARYLRLRWTDPGHVPEVQGAQLDSFDQVVASAPPLQWSEPWSPDRCDASSCSWRLPDHWPLDALQVMLAEPQTVARLRVVGENPPGTTPSTRERRHLHPLHAWRALARNAPVAAPGPDRTTLAETVVWRLPVAGGSESVNPPLLLDGSRYQTLHLQADRAVSEWGRTPPRLLLGARTRSLVLLVRGPGPYQLSWGNPATDGAAVDLSTLLPMGAPASWGAAHVELPAITRPPAAGAGIADGRAGAGDAPASAATHKGWLWAVLVAGLLLLGLMAASLLKKSSPASDREDR